MRLSNLIAFTTALTGAILIMAAPSYAQQVKSTQNQRQLAIEKAKPAVVNPTSRRLGSPNALSDIGQLKQMRLQQNMAQRSKEAQTVSNIQKKVSDTNSNIIRNMK